jgi:hypothetical protein
MTEDQGRGGANRMNPDGPNRQGAGDSDAAAARFGREARERYPDRRFDDVEAELRTGWEREQTGLGWDRARNTVREAFEDRSSTEWSDPGNPLA